LAIAACTIAYRASRSRVTMYVRGAYGARTYERKWWSIEETEDPTTLPVWQRDFRYGYQVLKRTMVESRKRGDKVFWECRVLSSNRKGCHVEMLNSGLLGFCPVVAEGPTRLEVGAVVKMECTACPQQRVTKEHKHTPWPNDPRQFKATPLFSHWLWLEQQASIKKARTLKTGEIVDGVVYKHLAKGLIITLDGEADPKGMLDMADVSRKMSSHIYMDKMFPVGTKIKCYVVHADKKNGRITLSTKEFEDDDHMGWMLSFPERLFHKAEFYAEKHKQKRRAYIQMLQR